jgi:hypothetical protein
MLMDFGMRVILHAAFRFKDWYKNHGSQNVFGVLTWIGGY